MTKLSFAQRRGIVSPSDSIQFDNVNSELRTRIWNIIDILIFDCNRTQYAEDSEVNSLFLFVWVNFLNRPYDEKPIYFKDSVRGLRKFIFECEWYKVYEFLEFIVNLDLPVVPQDFVKAINSSLEKENSAFRFVDKVIVEVTSENEINAIEIAVRETPYQEVKSHVSQALKLLSDKNNPDFRNSIKESISAVESLAKKISGNPKAELSDALSEIKKTKSLHPAYEAAFKKLYGWTSDADGIRHSLQKESNLSYADARFMLITCSAFVNYLIDVTKNKEKTV